MSEVPTMPPPARMQLNIISEVALSATGEARPIHILRTGTFTSGNGYTFTFEKSHLEAIEQSFLAGKRAKPPITECHDYGRAVGRIVKVWCEGDSLYAQPKWNKNGAQLLIDEVYDGFSCEIDGLGDAPTLIGGSLTNYPAVDGLQAVTLEAPRAASPPIVSLPTGTEYRMPSIEETRRLESAFFEETQARLETAQRNSQEAAAHLFQAMERANATTASYLTPAPLAAGGLREAHTTLQENTRMDENEVVVTPPADALPPITPPTFTASDPAVTAQVNAVVAQMTAQFEQQRQIVLEQAQAQFQRQMAEMQAQQQISTYAQHATTATLQRQHALPIEADVLTGFLSSLSAAQRTQAQGLFTRILDAGLVSFEEIGSQGEGAAEQSAKEQFDAAVQAKVSTGMSQLSAIQAVGKEQPKLYASYQAESSRRGAVQFKKGVK